GHFLKLTITEIDGSSLLYALGHRCKDGALHEIYLRAVHRRRQRVAIAFVRREFLTAVSTLRHGSPCLKGRPSAPISAPGSCGMRCTHQNGMLLSIPVCNLEIGEALRRPKWSSYFFLASSVRHLDAN